MAGKASIVTGGAQVIGKTFAGVLLEDGYKVSVSVYYRSPKKLRECNVFSHVYLFTGRSHYRWCIGPHHTRPLSVDMGHHCSGPPPTARRHIVAKTGDLLKPRPSDIWWLLKYVLFASRRYSSYWNAFLFFFRKGPVRECVKYSSFSLHFYLVRSHM